MDLEATRHEFESKTRIFERLKDEALFILEPAINDAHIKLHSISHRVKKVDSFLDKVQRKQSEKPFEDIQDIVGIRVICLFQSDIERVANVIRESFSVLDEDNKIEGTDVSSFGYMSVHFIATMKAEHSGPRYDAIANTSFEIQVRTIAMDAWANVSHYLDYKTDEDIPKDLKRDFYALSGLFYVADRHFEMFFLSRQTTQEKMIEIFEEAPQQVQLNQELNLDSLAAYLHTKFPDRTHADANRLSLLISELSRFGYRKIGDVDRTIEAAKEAFVGYENEFPAATAAGFSDVGVLRISAQMLDEKLHRYSYFKTIVDSALDDEPMDDMWDVEQERYNKYRKLLRK